MKRCSRSSARRSDRTPERCPRTRRFLITACRAVYHGGPDHVAFLNEAYALNSQANPLHADLWPSATKFEAEVASMTAGVLGAAAARSHDPERPVVGAVTSGGTESILLAMK